MTRRPWFGLRAAVFATTMAAVALAALAPGVARAEPVLPDFDAATFVPGQPIDNAYFPLVPNTRYHYTGVEFDPDDPDAEGEPLKIEVNYLAPGIGRVFVEADFGDDGVALNTVALERVTAIPLPPAFLPALGVLATSALVNRYRRRREAADKA